MIFFKQNATKPILFNPYEFYTYIHGSQIRSKVFQPLFKFFLYYIFSFHHQDDCTFTHGLMSVRHKQRNRLSFLSKCFLSLVCYFFVRLLHKIHNCMRLGIANRRSDQLKVVNSNQFNNLWTEINGRLFVKLKIERMSPKKITGEDFLMKNFWAEAGLLGK